MIAWLLARRLRRIRRRRFLFVAVEMCEPFSGRPGWVIEGRGRLYGPVGERIQLAAGPQLWRVLREAESEANRLFDEYGTPRAAA